MERNLGLLALLIIATVAAWWAPPVTLFHLPLTALLLLSLAFVAVNVVLMRPAIYAVVDRMIVSTPLRRLRAARASIYAAITPYGRRIASSSTRSPCRSRSRPS